LFVAKNSSGFEMSSETAAKKRFFPHVRHVYRFILEAMNGDRTKASTIFHKYLAGELPEELLFISSQRMTAAGLITWVQARQRVA